MQRGQDGKSRRLLVELTSKTCVGDGSKNNGSFIFGAKSGIWVDPNGRLEVGARNGLDLITSTSKDVGGSLLIGQNDGTKLNK